MNRFCRWVACFASLLLPCVSVRAADPTAIITHPFPGITLTEQTRTAPPLRLHWIQADLTNPSVHLRVCPGGPVPAVGAPWETTLSTVSSIARREKLDIAVNGSFFATRDFKVLFGKKIPYFAGNPARASGFTLSDGRLWSSRPQCADYPSLLVAPGERVSIGRLLSPPVNALQIVSGCQLLVFNGKNIGQEDAPAPRTVAGLDHAAKTLTLLVIDGRRPTESAGLSTRGAAAEMIRLGCDSALNLDSGGSSTLVVRDGSQWPVINTPSDGHDFVIPLSIERAVANALGIVVDKSR